MTTTVSTLQELLEAIASASTNDTIQLTDSISITSSTEFTSDKSLNIDLNSNTISISAEKGIFITDGNYTFSGGSITSAVSDGIWIEGADTSLTLSNDLTVYGTGIVVDVQKKATLVISGASITSTTGDGAVINVEGYTNANANSNVYVDSGTITAGDNHAIDVSKKGIAVVGGGTILSESAAISKEDETATTVSVTGGSFKGTIPEDAVDYDVCGVSEPDIETGIYTVYVKDADTETDADSEVDVDTETDPVDVDTETDADTETDVDPEPTPEPEPEPEPDTETDIDTETDVDTETDADTDTDVDPEPQPEPTPEPEPTPDPQPEPISDEPTSFVVKRSTRVFRTPSAKHPIDDVVGPILVFSGTYTDPKTNTTFVKIQYTLPGNGRKAAGYAFSSAVNGTE